MRKVIIFFYLIGIYGCFCQTQKHNYQVQEKFLKNFYFEYLIKTDIDKYDKVVIRQNYQKIMNAYCTENLVNKINGMPRRLPTHFKGGSMRYTKVFGRFLGRLAGPIGWGILIYDVGKTLYNTQTIYNSIVDN